MAEDNNLFAIEVDADDYADTAADDTPSVSRTHQSRPAFESIKSSYSAKITGGTSYKDLIAAVPVLAKPWLVMRWGRCTMIAILRGCLGFVDG
ncbi:uncharacterized protein LTR77_004586 [Saxophila tyrrhenica]|uniref:Uncharacterized protein n=1 Tax=Saxophila tyrrhenica TaxID=1690608 RepID=A0AAV9PG41_9PEZI|nr:hypothetical protein LTR77_004586 [Saxophila tyrrhenica]